MPVRRVFSRNVAIVGFNVAFGVTPRQYNKKPVNFDHGLDFLQLLRGVVGHLTGRASMKINLGSN